MMESRMNNPMMLSGFCDKWPSRHWTFESISKLLGDTQFDCRISPKSCNTTMETECMFKRVTVGQFHDWLKGHSSEESPLHMFPNSKYCCYIDYKYMKDMFSEHQEMFEQVQWKDFGLDDFNGQHSTIWLGSEGANTPGHQDTYGFNLVTQLVGRKLWILFPPKDMQSLYASRVPYEESSVFTQVNVRRPDLALHPEFQRSHPVVIVLHPGQTLYVPRHWWHYVESLDPSISVNVWVPVEQDTDSSLHEAVTRLCASSLIENLGTHLDLLNNSCLNPTETLYTAEVNLAMLRTSLHNVVTGGSLSGGFQTLSEDGDNSRNVKDKNGKGEASTKPYRKELSSRESFSEDEDVPLGAGKELSVETKTKERDDEICAVRAEKSNFLSFQTTIQNYETYICESPYGFEIKEHSLLLAKRKWVEPSSQFMQHIKRKKMSSEIPVTGGIIDSRGDLQNQSECVASQKEQVRRVVSVKPCTFSCYIQFLDSLCEYSQCSACGYGQQHSTRSADRLHTSSHCDSQRQCNRDKPPQGNGKTIDPKVATHKTRDSVNNTCTSLLCESGNTNTSGHTETSHSVHDSPDSLSSTPLVNASLILSNSEILAGETSVANLNRDDLSRLSDKEIAECLLVSVLHPNVVTQVVTHFKAQCDLYLKSKQKKKDCS